MPVWFSDDEYRIIEAACERLIPAEPELGAPGARTAGVADYIDQLLGAFNFDPPRIWAGGPFSGRHGGEAAFERWIPLPPADELAWRIRIEGSLGIPEREFNGPVVGLQERYRRGIEALGADFADVSASEQDARLDADPDFRDLLYGHACEGMYGDPVYGGNRHGIGWAFISFAGDSQPRGYTDGEVRGELTTAPSQDLGQDAEPTTQTGGHRSSDMATQHRITDRGFGLAFEGGHRSSDMATQHGRQLATHQPRPDP
ncbi:MAG: gluconate 2-dehydrogenase subunit 3 family protein, partial [Acidimicrobiales bacterium]|nr:gluconate 2-dehydrogenase subunit 3 family protein [Acidimicrobiales bacterium]